MSSREALGLYRRAGFRERVPFGAYQPDPLGVFMEKVPTADRADGGLRDRPCPCKFPRAMPIILNP